MRRGEAVGGGAVAGGGGGGAVGTWGRTASKQLGAGRVRPGERQRLDTGVHPDASSSAKG